MLHVNVANGEVCYSAVDFVLPGFIPFQFERSYKSHSNHAGLLGWNWNHPLDVYLRIGAGEFLYCNQWGAKVSIPFLSEAHNGLVAATADSKFKLFRDEANFVLHTPDLRRSYFPITRYPTDILRLSRLEDLNGNAMSYEYDAQGRFQYINDTLGRRIRVTQNQRYQITGFQLLPNSSPGTPVSLVRYEYDKDDNLVAVLDNAGNACRFEYRDHLIVSFTNRLGGSQYAEYDRERRCTALWCEDGIKERKINYDPVRRTTALTDSLGNTTLYRYNEANLVTEAIDPLGGISVELYDAGNTQIASINKAGRARTTTLYDESKRTLTVSDAAGATTIFEENDRGQVTSKTDAAGATQKWEYDISGSVSRVVRPSGAETRFEYDGRGFLVKFTDARGSVITQSRSRDGKMLTVRDEFGPIMEYRYDDLGMMIEATNGKGARQVIRRDASRRTYETESPDGARRSYEYDAEGNLTKIVDEIGSVTRLQYDRFGKCIRLTESSGESVHYVYDTEENPVAIINEVGESHRFVYDPLGRVIAQSFFDGSNEQYEYDESGNIVGLIDGEGRQTKIKYDAVRNMIEKSYPDGTRESFSYDTLRRLTDLQNDTISIHLEYDPDGNLVQEVQGERILSFTYDEVGNRTALEDSKGRTIRYAYDLRGRLTSIADDTTGTQQFTYDAIDLLVQHHFPNGAVLHNEYDRRNRHTRQNLVLPSPSEGLLTKSYQFDPTDRLIEDAGSISSTKNYKYDASERLISVDTSEGSLEQFAYDSLGNIIQSSGAGYLSYGKGSVLINTTQGRRDFNRRGELVRALNPQDEIEYEYDGAGRLSTVRPGNGPAVKYAYDAFGRRVSKVCNGVTTEFTWDGLTLLEETRNETQTQYLFDQGRMIPLARAVDQRVDFFVAGRRGEVFATLDQGARITGQFDYSAFGTLLENSTPGTNSFPHPFRLRGQYYDEETGFHYNLHRYYEPGTGRFLTRDPLGIDAGRNLYRNGPNPLTWEDPFGLKSSECQGDVFYRAMSDQEKEQVMKDCQLHAKDWNKCPEGPYVTQNRPYCEGAMAKKPETYKHLAEICTKPGTTAGLFSHPLACRNGSQAKPYPTLPKVQKGNFNRIEFKIEGTKQGYPGTNYGLSKGGGLTHFNGQIDSMKIVGSGETCTPA